MHLPFDERRALIEAFGAVDTGGKVIMINTGGLALEQVVELTRPVVAVQLDGAVVIVPPDVPAEAVLAYLRGIAAVGAPFTVYWSPVASGHRPSLPLVAALSAAVEEGDWAVAEFGEIPLEAVLAFWRRAGEGPATRAPRS
ncbi:MAG: hypothetical protein JXB06_03615 [Spirochaetales bacterium]|nr:hypothetical protein [Spirochaetales bacterium]